MNGQRARWRRCATACAGDENENVMPSLIECAEADATLGETVDVMRAVFGEYVEPLIV